MLYHRTLLTHDLSVAQQHPQVHMVTMHQNVLETMYKRPTVLQELAGRCHKLSWMHDVRDVFCFLIKDAHASKINRC